MSLAVRSAVGSLFGLALVVGCGGAADEPKTDDGAETQSAAISTCGPVPKVGPCLVPVCVPGDGWDIRDKAAGTPCPNGGTCNGSGTCVGAAPPPPPPPQYCPLVNPTCHLSADTWSTGPGFVAELGATGACGTRYHYASGNPADLQISEIALCADTTAVRDVVGKYAKWSVWRPIIGVNVCDACLPVAAAGKIYVVWADAGPVCGSSCKLPWGGGV